MKLGIWDRMKKAKAEKEEKKRQEEIERYFYGDDDEEIEGIDPEDHYVYENENAQSWNKETHPEGRGDSYVVKAIHYNGKTKELIVEYRWGDVAKYSNISKDFVERFNKADSKGRFAMQNLWDKAYEEV